MSEDKSAEVIPIVNAEGLKFIKEDLKRSGLEPEDFNLVPDDPTSALAPFTETVLAATSSDPKGFNGQGKKQVEVTGYSIRYPSYEHDVFIQGFMVKRFANHPDHKYEGTKDQQHIYWVTPYTVLRTSKTKFIVEGEKKALSFAKYLDVPVMGLRGCAGFSHKGKPLKAFTGAIKEGDNIYVCLDGDFVSHPNVKFAAGTLARQIHILGGIPKFVVFPNYPDGSRMGADDWIMAQNTKDKKELRHRFNSLDIFDWHELPEWPGWMTARLKLMSTPGKVTKLNPDPDPIPIRNEENTALIMEDLFPPRALFTDQYKGTCYENWKGEVVPYADDTLDSTLYRYIERIFGTWSKDAFRSQRRAMLGGNKRNMLGEKLLAIKWDGVKRIETFLITHFGANDTTYTRKVSKGFLMGAMARCFDPGVKWDHVPIFEGEQSIGKTKGLELLCYEEYYGIITFGGNEADVARKCASKLINNCDELDHMNKTGRESFKSWVSNCIDSWVPKYIEYVKPVPRSFVVTGTTNMETYLDDPTGARRFWPVKVVRPVDHEAIKRDRDQLWAEAIITYREAGAMWWAEFEDKETGAKMEQASREHDDPLTTILEAQIETHNLPIVKVNGHDYEFVTYHWLMAETVNTQLPAAKKSMHALNDAIKRLNLSKIRVRGNQIDKASLDKPTKPDNTVKIVFDQFAQGHIPDQLRVYARDIDKKLRALTLEDEQS